MKNKAKVVGIYTDWNRPGNIEGIGAIGWYRIINPLEKMGYPTIGKLSLGSPELALKLKEKGDIWLWKPVDNEGMNVIIDTAKHFTDSKIILDLDDEPFDINKDHPIYDEIVDKSPRVARMIEIADHLIVSTHDLKKSLARFGKKTTVIPNAIDPSIWKVENPKKRTDGKIRIGWIGSASHVSDIPVVSDAIDEIVKKYPQVEIHLCGFMTELKFQNDRYKHHVGTAQYTDYPQFLADLDLDIAIAPLIDTNFNRCKSNIKWMEHAMLEIPMVLSDISPYSSCVTNYKTGYLAKGKGQWVKYLSWLIENEEKRKEIGKSAKEAVLKDYTIDKQLPKYEELFEKMRKKDITVYTSITGDKDVLNEKQNTEGADFVAFFDGESDIWETRKPFDKFSNPRLNSRIQKIMPHLYFDTEYTIYMDGNISLNVPAQQLIDEFLKDKDIAVFRHVGRDCPYDEAEACAKLGKGNKQELSEQVRAYAKNGLSKHQGLAECGVIIRRNTKEINDMGEKWWAHYCRYSERDQISFPIAFDLNKVNLIESSAWRHPYFTFISHVHEK